MNERTRPDREHPGAPGGAGSLFDESPETPAPVTVSSGPYIEQLPLGRRSIGEIRRLLGARLDLDPHSQAVLDVHWLPTQHTLRQVAARIFQNQQAHAKTPRTAAALARHVFNHQAS